MQIKPELHQALTHLQQKHPLWHLRASHPQRGVYTAEEETCSCTLRQNHLHPEPDLSRECFKGAVHEKEDTWVSMWHPDIKTKLTWAARCHRGSFSEPAERPRQLWVTGSVMHLEVRSITAQLLLLLMLWTAAGASVCPQRKPPCSSWTAGWHRTCSR